MPDKVFVGQCNLCSNSSQQPILTHDGYQIVECRRCGLRYTNPRLDIPSLEALYNSAAYYENYSSASWDESWTGAMHQELARIEHYVSGRRLLEIGCGGGLFIASGQQRGWSVQGQEISQASADHAKTKYGLDVFIGDVASAHFADASFDVVAMFHVLEHVDNPRALLLECWRILSPGGLVVIGVPHMRSLDLKLDKQTLSRVLHLPFHLYHFDPHTLTAYLKATNFEPVFMDAGITELLVRARTRIFGSKPVLPTDQSASSALFTQISYTPRTDFKIKLRNGISRLFPGSYIVAYGRKPS